MVSLITSSSNDMAGACFVSGREALVSSDAPLRWGLRSLFVLFLASNRCAFNSMVLERKLDYQIKIQHYIEIRAWNVYHDDKNAVYTLISTENRISVRTESPFYSLVSIYMQLSV